MNEFLDLFTILICSIFAIKAIKNILTKNVNAYYILLLVFYIMQVFPLITDYIYRDQLRLLYPKVYNSMIDEKVGLIYDLVVVVISYVLYYWGVKDSYNINIIRCLDLLKNVNYNKLIYILFLLLACSPIFAVLFSPNPSIYFEFSFLYNGNSNATMVDILFFDDIVNSTIYISLIFIIALYVDNRNNKFFIYLLVFLVLWISQKRAFIFFALGGILFIDILQEKYKKRFYKILIKTTFFIFIAISYFVVYSSNTIKEIDKDSSYPTYVMYGTRHYCMKTAIYDSINQNKILDYPGQSILYDLFFFIPRNYWEEKPVMYQRYFTAYLLDYRVDDKVGKWLNLLVNIWTEFISNFGVGLGVILGLLLIKFLINISNLNPTVYISVTLFLCAYFTFGFEFMVILIYIFWIFSLIKYKLSSVKMF